MKQFVYENTLKFISMLGLVIAPIQSVVLAVFALVMIDMITGIWAAIKFKEPLTSSGFGRTISKLVLYGLGIAFCFGTEQLLLDGIPLVKAFAGLIAMREAKSFFENLNRISGIDFWSVALEKIQAATVKKLPEQDVVVEVDLPNPRKSQRNKRKKRKNKK